MKKPLDGAKNSASLYSMNNHHFMIPPPSPYALDFEATPFSPWAPALLPERFDLDADLGDLDLESCERLVALGATWSARNQAERVARLRAETAGYFGRPATNSDLGWSEPVEREWFFLADVAR